MFIKKDDVVEIVTGDDRGSRGRVLSVNNKKGTIVVEGVNRVYKHMKPSRQNQQGGRLSKEMPINATNAMLICPQTNRPTRIGIRYLEDGSKEIYAKRSGAGIRKISPPRQAYAGSQTEE